MVKLKNYLQFFSTKQTKDKVVRTFERMRIQNSQNETVHALALLAPSLLFLKKGTKKEGELCSAGFIGRECS